MKKRIQCQPTYPRQGKAIYHLARPLIHKLATQCGLYPLQHPTAQNAIRRMRQKIAQQEIFYVLGMGAGGHHSGVALLKVDPNDGLTLLTNNEEERFCGVKHFSDYPTLSIAHLRQQLKTWQINPNDILACALSWDYIELISHSLRTFFQEFPHSYPLLFPQRRDTYLTDYRVIYQAFSAPRRLQRDLGLKKALPCLTLCHHDNHAYFSYAVSPFSQNQEPTLVLVSDGSGDDASLSIYHATDQHFKRVYHNGEMFDSLGTLYSVISATQGGWTPLSSEGRYMGAVAWGERDRSKNSFYKPLREILCFQAKGEIRLNKKLANWHRGGYFSPYTARLQEILGKPIPPNQFWNPDRVLRLDPQPNFSDRSAFDKCAALQMVFEDALVHILTYWLKKTGIEQLVLTGGSALNCVANQYLLRHFDRNFYAQDVGKKDGYLRLWVPPIPSDTGTPAGAAYHLVQKHIPLKSTPLQHAFYGGSAPTFKEIIQAWRAFPEFQGLVLGRVDQPQERERVANHLANWVAEGQVVGLFQGRAETGPRALGHRSILANPCQQNMTEILNQRVKYREPFRPLAPMLSLAEAQRFFELAEGAAADQFNAYRYMVLTATAKASAYQHIPAVIHRDGTSRLQIVHPETDPFCAAYLQALQRKIGVAVSVNTSLNVSSPIAQTPLQALQTLQRAKGMSGILFIADDARAMWVYRPLPLLSVAPK